MDVRRIVLVRHGQTDWNAEGRWQGHRDIPLSTVGRQQAEDLARRLEGWQFSQVVASSLCRARETAELVSRSTPTLDAALMEISYGEWEGVRDVDVRAQWPDLRALWGTAPDQMTMIGGESLAEVDARAWPAFQRWIAASEGDVLVVAHGGVNRILLSRILHLPLGNFWRIAQDPTAVNIIEVPVGSADDALAGARVRLLNCTAHLREQPDSLSAR